MYEKGSAILMLFTLADKTKQLVMMANKSPLSVHSMGRFLSVINKDANNAINWCEKISSSGYKDSSIRQLQSYAEFVKSWMNDIENAINDSDVKSMQSWTKNGYKQALKRYYTLYAL